MTSDRNWAQDPSFDPAAMRRFEERLARARPEKRPGYLRVKGATLLEAGDRKALEIAIELLRRVVDEHDHGIDVPWAHELLGIAYARQGDLASAEEHLGRCLQTSDEHRNGTSGVTELFLAEVLLSRDRVQEAADLLHDQDLRDRLLWDRHIYRYCVAAARVEDRLGGDPRPWAEEALRRAEDDQPQLARHPDVGRARPEPAEIREMRRLLARPRPRRLLRRRRRG